MKTERIQDAMTLIRDAYILEAHGESRTAQTHWLRWGALAACLCIAAAAALPGLLRRAAQPIEPAPEIADAPGGAAVTESGDWPVIYNEAAAVADSAKNAFPIFCEPLTEAERGAVIPAGLPDWLPLTAAYANYYRWDGGVLESVALHLTDPETEAAVDVAIRPAGQTVYYDEVFEPEEEPRPTRIGDMDVLLYRWEYRYGVMLWTQFQRGGVDYYVSASGEAVEQTQSDFFQTVAALATAETTPDLSVLHFHPERHVFREEELSLTAAREDPDFGAYFLPQVPEGFATQIRREQNSDLNFDRLSGTWDRGYDYLTWTVSYLSDAEEGRMVSAAEREKYDLSLYPIPLSESVPAELWEVVNDPVFRAEELTEELVAARCMTWFDRGEDRAAEHLNLSVVYEGKILVSVSASGIDAHWLYEQLSALGRNG